ncbi:melatonin receptor [Desmophyllum pertusum]|uniref:Melatonin receptor n=1 Tax=Desmophyllum pertusum TaxID=174260 RepID=A0A9X0CQ06_9CNID|nr:melatonin receptor [Desmophyllum pertusum]
MNATLTRIEIFAQQLKSRSTAIQVTESVFMLLINFASFAGNLLLGIAVIKNPNLRRTVPNMYIITLAVSDFLMSLLGIPFSAASLIVGEWPFNNFVCQLQGFWILLMCAASLQTLAVTAVNRYFRVVRSRALYQKLFNVKTTKITIAVVWIMAFFAPLPYVAAGHEFFFHTGKVFCAHDSESLYHGYGAYLVLVYVAIPLIIIITCYTRVFIAVRKHNLKFRLRFRARTQSNASTDSNLSVDEINITYILLVVVIGFLTCWTPVMVIDIIDFINADWKLKRQVTASVVRADDNHDDNGDEARNNPQSLIRNKVGVSFEIDERIQVQSKVVQCERSRLYRANSWASKRDIFSIRFASTHSL